MASYFLNSGNKPSLQTSLKPADRKIDRECRCTLCASTPQGYRLLKYGTYYKHKKQEEALQAMLAYRAQVKTAQERMQTQVQAPSEHRFADINNTNTENEPGRNDREGPGRRTCYNLSISTQNNLLVGISPPYDCMDDLYN